MRFSNVGGRVTMRLIAISIGASSLIAQTVLVRELLVAFCGNEISIGIVFAGWMLWVAAGSWVGGFVRASARTYLVSALLFVVLCPLTLHAIRMSRELVGAAGVQYLSLPQIMVVALGALCPMCLIVGLRFPMVVGLSSLFQTETRKSAGTVYALESVGAIVGGVLMTCVLLPFLNSLEIVLLAGGIGLLSGLPLLAVSCRLRPGITERPAVGTDEPASGPCATLGGTGHGSGMGFVDAVLASLAVVGCVCIGVVLIGFGEKLDLASTRAQWRAFNPKLALVERRESRYQNIAVLEYAGQRSIYGNGRLMFSVVDERRLDPEVEESSNIAFAHLAMTEHRDPRSVLLIGGGATGVLREVLKHPVTRVDYVEFDFVLLEVTKRLLPEADKAALADPRVRVHEMDGRRFVSLAKPGSYDLVIASLSDPTTLGMNRLFTLEFFLGAARALKPDGVFVTGMTSAYSPMGVLLDANATIYHTLRAAFERVMFVPGDYGMFFASNTEGQLLYSPDALMERFAARGVVCAPDGFRPEVFYLWIEENQILWTTFLLNRHGRAQNARADMETGVSGVAASGTEEEITTLTVGKYPLGGGEAVESAKLDRDRYVNSDSSPMAVVYSLLVWSRFANPGRRDMLDWLLRVELWWLGPAMGAVLLFCIGAGVVGRRARRCAVPPALVIAPRRIGLFVLAASCGFAGMAVQIVLLLAFQNVVGHVYSMIGALVAAFMAGMVGGAVLGQRLATQLVGRKDFEQGGRGSCRAGSVPEPSRDREGAVCREGEAFVGEGEAPAEPCFAVRVTGRAALATALVSRLLMVVVGYVMYVLVALPLVEVFGVLAGGALFFVANAAAGCLTGLCFPLFVAMWAHDSAYGAFLAQSVRQGEASGVGRAAAWLYGADLLGACLGALVVGAVAIPVLGLLAACHVILATTVVGLACFAVSRA